MKVQLLFVLLSLAVLLSGPAGETRAQSPTPDSADPPVAGGTTPTTGSDPSTPPPAVGTPGTASGAGVPDAASAGNTTPAPLSFAGRMASLQPSEAGDLKVIPAPLNNVCFPESQFKAYGFYTLGPDTGEVNFGVYSRIQYYSLTPQWDGDIVTPGNSSGSAPAGGGSGTTSDWEGAEVTDAAHRHGSSVDLVISNKDWYFEDGRHGDPNYEFDGLWLTKSYVILTLIDDIADLLSRYRFDGVTLDFALPNDVDTLESYTFLVNHLKNRLEDDARGSRSSDLLASEATKLNIVIDADFADTLAGNDYIQVVRNAVLSDNSFTGVSREKVQALTDGDWAKIIDPGDSAEIPGGLSADELGIIQGYVENTGDPTTPALTKLFEEFASSVDLVFVDQEARTTVTAALKTHSADRKTLIVVPMVSNEEAAAEEPESNRFNANLIEGNLAGIWDVSSGGEAWQTSDGSTGLESRVFGQGFSLRNSVSKLVCTSREGIASSLSGLTPVLALLVLVSWVFYGFPPRIKKSISNLVIWSLLAISFVALVLLLIGLPSINFESVYLWVIVSAFVLPAVYLVWNLGTRFGARDYP